MNAEEKQALIDHIETDLELLRNVTLKYCHEVERDDVMRDIKVNEIALAALTAQPIELPQRYVCEGYHIGEAYLEADDNGDCFDRDEVIEKLRSQGYEVQE